MSRKRRGGPDAWPRMKRRDVGRTIPARFWAVLWQITARWGSSGVGWVPDGIVIGAGPGPKITVDGKAYDVPEGIEIDPRLARSYEALREAAAIIREEQGNERW